MSKINLKSAAAIKRTAMIIAPINAEQEKLRNKQTALQESVNKKIAAIEDEIKELEDQKESFEESIMKMTGGYKTSDLIDVKVVENVKEDGKIRKSTTYTFKYPDTILPPEAENPSDETPSVEQTDDLPFQA